jgi:hypothetical protein
MAVCERDPPGAVVVARGVIDDFRPGGDFDHHVREPSGVNAIGMLIQQHVDSGRTGSAEVGRLVINLPRFLSFVVITGQPATRTTHCLAHAHAADTGVANATDFDKTEIGGALVNLGARQVRGEA